MEVVEDIVIVGAGIAGLTTALGLHRLGIRSLVLESSDTLRITGFAFTTWDNAWKALEAVGIADSLRPQHGNIYGIVSHSAISGLPTAELSFRTDGAHGEREVRCVKRKLLLETLAKELPSNAIRYSSKVDYIEDFGHFKRLHLADGTSLKTKVLIGCDGVNSVVGKWMGLKKPAFSCRSAIRGYAEFNDSHGYEPKFLLYYGKGIRAGFVPCDDHTVYWFFTFRPSTQEKEIEDDPIKMKEFVLSKLGKVTDKARAAVEITGLDSIICSPLRFRHPWELLWGNISKGNACVAGDALHPMTPDIGQGGCAALEDGVVLARCLAEALNKIPDAETEEREYNKRIEVGLKRFADERRWRGFQLISTAYVVGCIQQSDGQVMGFLRDNFLAGLLVGLLMRSADFDCGKLNIF